MIFVAIAQHSPAQCPGFNKQVFDMVSGAMSKLEDITKKHKVKIVGMYGLLPPHKTIIVMDAPSLDAAENVLIDSHLPAWNTTELYQSYPPEEAMKIAADIHAGKR